ncbi:hypothetical protein [Paraglaciecola psychrophila]|nr:hypothetical protein [Paraglaciecola psychrophila]
MYSVYLTVIYRVKITASTSYADVGCGSVIAAQIAMKMVAKVSWLDASSSLVASAMNGVPHVDSAYAATRKVF